MMWSTIPFQELYAEPSRNGLNRPKRVRGSGYRMVNMGELFAHDRIKDLDMDLVPMNESEKITYRLKIGDLLFARQSLVAEGAGKCSIILEVPEITTFESHLIRVRLNSNKANSLFYYYYFKSPQGKGNIQSLVMQVAAAGIRGSELSLLRVPYPPLKNQRGISDILSAYDRLIENNTRRIKILEEMAQLLYREWFINFRFPGYEEVELVESAIGFIPEGWEVKALDEISEEIIDYRGKTPKKLGSAWSSSGILAISAKNIKQGKLVNLDKANFVDANLYAKWMKIELAQYDILMTSEAPLGELYYIVNRKKFCLSQRVFGIRANIQVIEPIFLFLGLSSPFGQHELTSRQSGTTVVGIRQSELRQTRFAVPPLNLQKTAAKALNNFYCQIDVLANKNCNLRQTLDRLLPKLISGEIDVEAFDLGKLEMGESIAA
jgi:type I restriction enzyme, S subunit